MPSPAGVLFPQVTESPSREFIATVVKASGCTSLVVPMAGRFAVPAAAVPVLGAKNITCYDAGLIPSLIGYLADPDRSIGDLPVHVPAIQGLQKFVTGAVTEAERAAGVMLAIRYQALRKDTAYMAEQARQIRLAAAGLRGWLAGQLEAQAAQLAGIRYGTGPVAMVTGVPPGDGETLFLDLRGLNTRTRRELTEAEQLFWDEPPDGLGPKDIPALLGTLEARGQMVICCVTGDRHIPPSWSRMAAAEAGGKTDYVISTCDPGGRLVKTRRRAGKTRAWALYADQEITPASEVGIVCVDKDTALHYRDLMVHRLAGTTVSERYYLFLVDGRAVSVFGMHFRDQVTGKTDYCSMTFGITITSQRHARLGKLMMLCLTSRDMEAFLLHTAPNMLQRNPPAGLQTASPTVGHEGKADRGVMQLVRRVPRPGGTFQLLYRTEWRDESWPQAVARWHREQGWICRPGWDGPRLPQPQPETVKKPRGRGRRSKENADEQQGP
jgi:GNAT domain-containint protein